MNYYEELGISEQATEQEIRKAHRRLVKLMHPDAQPDPNLKLLAESQMRRLNSIVSTLIDPAQRQDYDRQLAAANHPQRQTSVHSLWNGVPWWLASTVAAVVLTLAAIWLWADHLGNTFASRTNTVYVPPTENRAVTPATAIGDSEARSRDVKAGTGIKNSQVKAPAEGAPIAPSPERGGSGGISATVVSDPPAPPAPAPVEQHHPVVRTESKSQHKKADPKPLGDAKSLSMAKARSGDTEKKKPPSLLSVSQPPRAKTPEQSRTPAQGTSKVAPVPESRKFFALPAGSLIAKAIPAHVGKGSAMPLPPGVNSAGVGHDYSSSLPGSSLPAAAPPPKAPDVVVSSASGVVSSASGVKDPLEGEWVYAPKEPERRRAGFYPPEFIDLKLFGSSDIGSLRGRYSAKYLVTDKPVSPEVSFELAAVTRGSRKFLWQSSNGARGTLNIDPIDERTIRIDWHTTTAMPGPALTSGQATLVRRQ